MKILEKIFILFLLFGGAESAFEFKIKKEKLKRRLTGRNVCKPTGTVQEIKEELDTKQITDAEVSKE